MKGIRLLTFSFLCLAAVLQPDPRWAAAQQALPGESCQTAPLPEWTEPERWVWKQLCEGRIADFNTRYLVTLDSKERKGWDEKRELSSVFLETILLHEPFRGALTRKGVRIVGAWFRQPVDLDRGALDRQLWLDRSRFESNVSLLRLRSPDLISLEGSKFTGRLVMASMELGGSLIMRGAEFGEVVLRGARIRDQLDMTGSKFTGRLVMDSLELGGSLFMRVGAEFGEVVLRGARIGDQLDMTGSKFSGKLVMESMEVGGSLFMRGGDFSELVSLDFSKIGSNVDLSGAKLKALDLTGARIVAELWLDSAQHPATKWRDGAQLTLRNTVVDAWQDRKDGWPEKLELEGFTYNRLGGFGAAAGMEIADRETKWFTTWLAKDQSYSPQPYEQLAGVLREAGKNDKADDILYAGKERERANATGLRWLRLTFLNYSIGYGYRIYYSFFWMIVIGFSLPGVARVMQMGMRQRERRRDEERRKVEQQRLALEVGEAATQLGKLFPKSGTFKMPGICLAHRNVQATSVSGDFYNFIPRSGGSLAIYFVDVQGHGLPASLQARSLYQTLMDGDWGMGDARSELERADELVTRGVLFQKERVGLCMNFTEVDPQRGIIRHANAGMPFPLLFRWGQSHPESIQAAGVYIGAGYSRYPAEPSVTETTAGSGDILVIASDGILEARDRRGRIFGQKGILAAVSRRRDESPEEIATEILRAVEKHIGREEPDDDQTLVVVQIGERIMETRLAPVTTLEGENGTFRLVNAGDTGAACHDELREKVKAWGEAQQYHERRIRQIWAATWEGIQNTIKYGSKRGDVINIQLIPADEDGLLGVEIKQPLIWEDWNKYLGRSKKLEAQSDRLLIGGAIIMLRLANEVSVGDQGRRVTMRFAPGIIPEPKVFA